MMSGFRACIVDELAHTNVEGSRHRKRWEDVMELLDANINVISAINIQHIESLSGEVKEITGIGLRPKATGSAMSRE